VERPSSSTCVPTAKTTRRGDVISYVYDDLNRLTNKTAPGIADTYTYDAGSRLKTAVNSSGTITYAYDELDRVKGVDYAGVHCILVDEVQFLSRKVIDELRRIALDFDIPILCYGLRTDFKSNLFEGSSRLMELADSIEEIKATCHYCNRKSIMNLKHVNGLATSEGPSVELGAEEKIFPYLLQVLPKRD